MGIFSIRILYPKSCCNRLGERSLGESLFSVRLEVYQFRKQIRLYTKWEWIRWKETRRIET